MLVQTWGYKCLEGHINPLMEDSSWWVRKAVVGSCLRFAKEDGTRVRSIVQENMVSGSNFSGRFAAVQTSLKITKAMSGEDEGRGVLMDILYRALVDEHWVVRQAAYDGLIDITPDDSNEPVQRAFEMLKDERAPIRRIAIDLLKKFMRPKNKHDVLSNQVLSSKAIVTGFANKAMYEKLDADNNCRVNAEEIKQGFRKFANIDIGMERTFDFLGPENRDGDLSYDEFMNLLRSGHGAQKSEQDTPIQVCSNLLEQLIDQLPDKEEESLVRLNALRHAYATEHERFCREALLECLFDMTPLGDRDWPFLVQSCLRDVNPNIFKTATKNLQAYIDDVGDAILNGSVHVLVDLDALQVLAKLPSVLSSPSFAVALPSVVPCLL
jgi:HEAT repeat protein